jgi:hypothetical protein
MESALSRTKSAVSSEFGHQPHRPSGARAGTMQIRRRAVPVLRKPVPLASEPQVADSHEEVESVLQPLGSDAPNDETTKGRGGPQRQPQLDDVRTVSCRTCQDLQYRHEGFDTASANYLYPEALLKRYMAKFERRSRPDGAPGIMLLTNDLPPFPPAQQWIRSATSGCVHCQLVVDGISTLVPQFFAEYNSSDWEALGLAHKRWEAFAVMDQPLLIILVDSRSNWAHERYCALQICAPPGKDLSSAASFPCFLAGPEG